MCTLSWQIRDDNYLSLFFNRDELFSRAEAEPPMVLRDDVNRTRFLAPIDPQGGGTWIAANEYGLTFCLLNDYYGKSMEHLTDKARSRGLLVRKVAGFSREEDVRELLTKQEVRHYKPFNLLLFNGVKPPEMWHWNGEDLLYDRNPSMPVVSSGHRQSEVQKKRAAIFRKQVLRNGGPLSAEQQLRIHQSDQPQPQPWSIAMKLPDKGTVSITQVELTKPPGDRNYEICMRYWPGNPVGNRPEPSAARLDGAQI